MLSYNRIQTLHEEHSRERASANFIRDIVLTLVHAAKPFGKLSVVHPLRLQLCLERCDSSCFSVCERKRSSSMWSMILRRL